jgi:arylsulfatase A-like enzyme
MYDPASIAVPKSFGLGDSPMLRHMREDLAGGDAKRQSTLPYAVTEREAREAIALTYGMITMIDDAVGQVIKALEDNGLASNTVLVFASDHGDFMGDHGIMLKGPLHYRGLIRVPFIWFDPTTDTSSVITSLAQSIDIPATILERCGIRPYFGMQGTGLMPTIYDGETDGRDALLIEDDRELIYLGFDRAQRVRTVVTVGARMTLYEPAPWGELYDLVADPLEVNNLWNDPAHQLLQADMTRRLLELIIRFQDWAPLPTGRA